MNNITSRSQLIYRQFQTKIFADLVQRWSFQSVSHNSKRNYFIVNKCTDLKNYAYTKAVVCPSNASLSTGPDSWVEIQGLAKNDPKKGELVYVGPLSRMVRLVKMFSVSSSVIGLGVQPYLFLHAGDHDVAVIAAVGGIMGFFIFITPLLIHWITKKYVTDMYYDKKSDKYTTATISFFLRRKELEFKSTEVYVPDVPGMFTFLKAKGKPLFMDPRMFLSKEAYIRLMGYDKPIEWELKQENKKEN